MTEKHTSDKDQGFQAISHSSAESLNEKMRQKNLSASLELYLIRNPEIERLVNFIYPEDNDIQIQQSHERFLQYLRSRVGSFGKNVKK